MGEGQAVVGWEEEKKKEKFVTASPLPCVKRHLDEKAGWPGRRGLNIAILKSHIAQKRTLLHKLRKKYHPKTEFWAFFAFLLTNFIA